MQSGLRGDKMTLWEAYRKARQEDVPPDKSSALHRYLLDNPRLLVSEFGDNPTNNYSVIVDFCFSGAFNLSDSILRENNNFIAGVDPFYCGRMGGGLSTLLYSAGLNFYLALNTLRFYEQQNKLNELILTNADDKILRIRKTHYDCLYWTDTDGTSRPLTFRLAEHMYGQDAVKTYIDEVAPAFMTWAYEIFNVERKLINETRSDVKAKLYDFLSKKYLQIAYMEDYICVEKVFYYFFSKAREYYSLIPKEKQEYANNRKYYMRLEEQRAICKLQSLKEEQQYRIKKETGGGRIRNLSEWTQNYEAEIKYNINFTKNKKTISRETKSIDFLENAQYITIDTLDYPANSYPKLEQLNSVTERVSRTRTPSPSSVALLSRHSNTSVNSTQEKKPESTTSFSITFNPLCAFFPSADGKNTTSQVTGREKKNN